MKHIGILALQGNFKQHEDLINPFTHTRRVTCQRDFESLDGLIIPGGESTTMTRLIRENHLYDCILSFGGPILGTCAGLILMAQHVYSGNQIDSRVRSFGFLPIDVLRNAYGSQVHSGYHDVEYDGHTTSILFIRAPYIQSVSDDVEVIAHVDQHPCGVRSKNYMGLTFHPESIGLSYFHRLCFQI
jgi:5'-phosphate synthase pdxT subunit